MANRRNGPVTPGLWRFWGRKGLQRFTLIPHFCTAAGWELWFTTPRQAEATKIRKASQCFLLPQQILVSTCPGSPLPVVVTHTHTHIIKIIAYFCILPSTSFNYTNYTDYWWRVDNPRHATMHAMYARFWILIIGRRLWPVIQSQPSAACTTHAFGIPDSCRCPRGRISVYGCMREEQRLSFVDIVLPCSAHPALNFTLIRKYPLRICQIALCCIQNGWSAQYSYTLFSNLRCGCIEWTKSRNWSSICKLVWLVMNELSYVMRTLETDCFPLEIFWSPICVKVLSDSEGIRNGAGVGIPST